MRSCLVFLALLAFARPALANALAITVGDSIVESYSDDSVWPIQGWGADMPKHFLPSLHWRNDARGGASTKSFIDQGWWANTLAAHPQFILIQFGVSDDQPDPAYHTDPNTTYRANLHQMIVEARAIGAEPILVTPTAIRYVALDGIHVARPSALQPWADAMTAQAIEDGAALVDMHTWSLDTYDAIGMPVAQRIFGYLIPGGGDPPIPPGTPDTLHFSHIGADYAASMVARTVPAVSPNLALYLATTDVPALPWPSAALLVAALAAVVARSSSFASRGRQPHR